MSSVNKATHSAWLTYGPTLNFLIPALAIGVLGTAAFFYAMNWLAKSPTRRESDDIEWNLLAMDPRSRDTMKASTDSDVRKGHYQHKTQPSWGVMFLEMMAVGEILSLLFFIRLLLPMPDLVAGNNVVKDARQDFHGLSSNSARSSSKTSRTSKDSMALWSQQVQPQDAPWTERVSPISTSNRLWSNIFVVLARLVENFLICGILPRTHYICRATGHCPVGTPIWELSRIIFPAGITAPYREDGLINMGFLETDVPSAIMTMMGVISVTIVLLVAHALVMNRAYLAMLGYVAGEWKLLKSSEYPSTSTPGSWEPRKKYKEGDLVSCPAFGRRTLVYRATTNNPEAKPMDLAVFHGALQSELGHPSTSRILSQLTTIQLRFIGAYVTVWIFMSLMGCTLHGGLTGLVANMLAVHALVTVGQTHNFEELERLNNEIKASMQG